MARAAPGRMNPTLYSSHEGKRAQVWRRSSRRGKEPSLASSGAPNAYSIRRQPSSAACVVQHGGSARSSGVERRFSLYTGQGLEQHAFCHKSATNQPNVSQTSAKRQPEVS